MRWILYSDEISGAFTQFSFSSIESIRQQVTFFVTSVQVHRLASVAAIRKQPKAASAWQIVTTNHNQLLAFEPETHPRARDKPFNCGMALASIKAAVRGAVSMQRLSQGNQNN
jgi:hypothetical protein